mmetsp:Transcript_22643/g.52169  ORF Transcript_22643/g.52169 Transcript_22643/m.52169 type:complete len:201 (+) Transcript_22643:201-803(+)
MVDQRRPRPRRGRGRDRGALQLAEPHQCLRRRLAAHVPALRLRRGAQIGARGVARGASKQRSVEVAPLRAQRVAGKERQRELIVGATCLFDDKAGEVDRAPQRAVLLRGVAAELAVDQPPPLAVRRRARGNRRDGRALRRFGEDSERPPVGAGLEQPALVVVFPSAPLPPPALDRQCRRADVCLLRGGARLVKAALSRGA